MVMRAAFAYSAESPIAALALSPEDRVLVLAPHPDDEVLGAAGILQQAVSMKLPVKVVFLTNGDSNQWSFLVYRKHPVLMPAAVRSMGVVRRDEAVAASRILGIPQEDLVFLGYPDFGTMNMWCSHWNDRPPLRSLLTRVTKVPYQGAFRPGAMYKGEEVLQDLRSILRDFKPTKIFVTHPADHNGDHLAMYLYLRVALWDENMEGLATVHPFLIHYLGWPKPAGLHLERALAPPAGLKDIVRWEQYSLTPREMQVKKAALQAHQTQFKSTPRYLLSFVRPNELFGDFLPIRLHKNEESSVFSVKRAFVPSIELPAEYNSEEKTVFVGIEWKLLRWEGENLVVSISLSKPLAHDVEASIYIFGYNKGTPFGKMPKLSVRLGGESYTVYDQSRRIAQGAVTVNRTSNEVTITVPLKDLGDPDRVLTSARTYLGNVPLDSASWVAVELY